MQKLPPCRSLSLVAALLPRLFRATELLTDAQVIEGTNDEALSARLQAALETTHAQAAKEIEEQMKRMAEDAEIARFAAELAQAEADKAAEEMQQTAAVTRIAAAVISLSVSLSLSLSLRSNLSLRSTLRT
jgi:hypothetical protein